MEKSNINILIKTIFRSMKKIMLVCLVIISGSLYSQETAKTIKSKIKEVTVFFQGAQITQVGDITIPQGQSIVMFDNLTQYINPQSIQVKGEGDFTILSVTHQINYLKSQEKSPEVLRLEDSSVLLTKLIANQQTILSVYGQEESLLIANKSIGGQQTGVKIEELKAAAEYFRTRMLDIKQNQTNIQEKINQYQMKLSRINNQLATLNAKVSEPTSEILVTVNSETTQAVKLSLSYYTSNAGWTPTYELRAINVNSPIELNFRANVYQTTGTDWSQVKLTLSTGNPAISGSKPQLNPWYVSFITSYDYENKAKGVTAKPMMYEMQLETTKVATDKNVPNSIAAYTSVIEAQTTINYEISIPYNIPASGKYYTVEIQKNSLNAIYEYYCAPKLNPDVFLLARVSGWEKYNLISGEMNLFFEGTYVGKSFLDARITTDTIDLSMGIDKNISVKREKLVDLSSAKFIGLNKKVTEVFSISVKNKKKQSIDILIEDQIPLTTDKDIEIETIDISNGMLDKDYGKVSWRFKLNPAETKTLKLSYSVKYPKDKSISF
jgi:uncharacterized protein (TIGR02231 family)